MKILQIGSTAGVSNVLSNFINRYTPYSSEVVTRTYSDKYEISSFYGDEVFPRRNELFLGYLIFRARKFDILHIHSMDYFLPFLKKVFPRKKIILTYHGHDIRDRRKEKEKHYKHADFISVSTSDLTQEKFTHIKNIVDFNHFKNKKEIISNKALYMFLHPREKIALKRTKILIKTLYPFLQLEIINRWENSIYYNALPEFLSSFEFYFDIKMIDTQEGEIRISPFDLSYTAEQFLSMSKEKRVVTYNGRIIEGYKNTEKRNMNLIREWCKIYEQI